MDAIYVNGNILTMDEENPRVESVYTKYDRICGVGSTDEVRNMAGTRAEVIDLGGNTMLPGFVDTHNHMCMYALLTDQADCRAAAGCVTRSDVIDSIKAMADKTPKGQWIMGWGYAPYLLQDKSDLTREDLDLAGTDHPICLVHISVHGCVVNSLGLKELGFSRETPDPPGGKILRGANGEPNGILQESAFMGPLFFVKPSIYSKIISGYSEEGKAEMMARCIGAYHKLGLVGVHDPFVDAATLRIYQDVVGPHGSPFRLDAYILNYQADPLMEIGIRGGFGSSWLKVGHVKVFLDGGMSSRTAAVHEPYANGGTGITNYDQDAIDREIAKFDRAGYSISIHAQGDRGIGMALDAFERTMDEGNPLRHHIVHAGNITPEQIDRVKGMNLYITSQANFLSLLGDGFIEAYGLERAQGLYPFNTILNKGIKFSLSSDCPVADPDPLIGLRDAILRKTAEGQIIGKNEGLTAEKALAMYTREAAYFSFEECEKGTISEGMAADFVVLDKDPTRTAPEDIPDTKVQMTVVGGRIVYKR